MKLAVWHLAHGRIRAALRANPLGLVVALLASTLCWSTCAALLRLGREIAKAQDSAADGVMALRAATDTGLVAVDYSAVDEAANAGISFDTDPKVIYRFN